MAISLTSDGLSLNYPTSVQNSGLTTPVGCVVIFYGGYEGYPLSGTWAKVGKGIDGWEVSYGSDIGMKDRFFAIRVA